MSWGNLVSLANRNRACINKTIDEDKLDYNNSIMQRGQISIIMYIRTCKGLVSEK